MSSIKTVKNLLFMLACAIILMQALPLSAAATVTENTPNLPPQISEDDPEFELLDLSERRAITGPRTYVEIDPTLETKPIPGTLTITKKFIEFFPDPVFAQIIAAKFGKGINDPIATTQLATIGKLSIYESEVKSIEGIGYMPNISDLDLYSNKIETVKEDLGKLTKASQIDLSENNITELPDCFENIDNAWYLNVSYQDLKEIPISISKMKLLNRLDISYCKLKTIPEHFTMVLTNGGPNPHPPGNTPGNHAGDLFLRNNQITEIPEVYMGLMNKGENVSLCNQNATIEETKTFTDLDAITFADSVPPIVSQLKGILNQRAFKDMGTNNLIPGNITATLNGAAKTLTLAQLLDNNFKGSQLFTLGDGIYDVEFNTTPEWGYYGSNPSEINQSKYYHIHGKGHTYKYKVEISTGATLKTVVAGTASSDDGGYDISLNGFIDGYFPNGISQLTDAQIKGIYLNGLIVNTVSEVEETSNLSTNSIASVVIDVKLGKLETIKISGKAKTKSAKSELFTVTTNVASQGSRTFAMTGASIAHYQVVVSGLLPRNLGDGAHALTPLEISKLKQTGILYNKTTGEIRRLSQNAFNELEITINGGNIDKIEGKGTSITVNGAQEPYESIASYNEIG